MRVVPSFPATSFKINLTSKCSLFGGKMRRREQNYNCPPSFPMRSVSPDECSAIRESDGGRTEQRRCVHICTERSGRRPHRFSDRTTKKSAQTQKLYSLKYETEGQKGRKKAEGMLWYGAARRSQIIFRWHREWRDKFNSESDSN